jgi:hypothetical protein
MENKKNEKMKEIKGNPNGEFKLYEGGAHFKYLDLFSRLEKLPNGSQTIDKVNSQMTNISQTKSTVEEKNNFALNQVTGSSIKQITKIINIKKDEGIIRHSNYKNLILPAINSIIHSFETTSCTNINKKNKKLDVSNYVDNLKGIAKDKAKGTIIKVTSKNINNSYNFNKSNLYNNYNKFVNRPVIVNHNKCKTSNFLGSKYF